MDFRLQESPQTHVLSISIPCFIWEGAVVRICKLGMGHFRFQRALSPVTRVSFVGAARARSYYHGLPQPWLYG